MIKYTKLKDNNRQNLIDIIPLEKPFTLLIEPSNFCNFRCIQCFQSIKSETYLSKHKKIMDMELYQNIISQFKQWKGDKLKVLKLSLYGEPFTNPDFGEMLRIARQANIAERIETTTNASLLSEDLCYKLIKYEMDYIRVSIYASNQENYRKVTNTSNASIEEIHDNLKRIQDMKKEMNSERPFVSAKMIDTFTKDNDEFMAKFADVADELYIDKPHNWISHEEKSFIESLYDENQKTALETDLKQTLSNRSACPMPFTTLAIRSNGDVSPCCVDWLGGTNLGNVLETNIEDIWNGEAMYQFRKMQLENRRGGNSSCKDCELVLNDYYTRDNIDGFPVEQLRKTKQSKE